MKLYRSAWMASSRPKVAGTIESQRDQVRLDSGSQAKKVQELETRPSPCHPDRSDSEVEGSETFRRQHSSNGTSSCPLERPRHRNHPRSLRQGRDDECLRLATCPGYNNHISNTRPKIPQLTNCRQSNTTAASKLLVCGTTETAFSAANHFFAQPPTK